MDRILHSQWSFPDIEGPKKTAIIEVKKNLQPVIPKPDLEVEKLKKNYQEKTQLLEKILTCIEMPMEALNDTFIELLQEIVKKSVKKIIFKEMTLDPSLINHIVDELKKGIIAHHGVVSIHVAEEDYQFLKDMKSSASIQVDSHLSKGDVIIKTNLTEIRAVLDERIEKILENNTN